MIKLALKLAKYIIALLVFTYCAIAMIALLFHNKIAFQPPPAIGPTGSIDIVTEDGCKLNSIYLQNANAKYVILYNHGNAEHLGYIDFSIKELYNNGFSVFAWDYRGYNASSGRPDEQLLKSDAEAVYAYLNKVLGVPEERIIVYGRSLGSYPAIVMASRHKPSGLVLESAFTSGLSVIMDPNIFPFDYFNNLEMIGKANCPVIFLHGNEDTLVKPWHAETLFLKARESKKLVWLKAGHNDVPDSVGYWEAIHKFVNSLRDARDS